MTIHHTQLKQAAALGGTLAQSDNNPDVFIATKGPHSYLGRSPKEALDKMIAALGGKPAKAKKAKAPKVGEVINGKPTPGADNIAAQEAKEARKPKKKKTAKKARKSEEDEEGEEGEEEEESGRGSVVKAKYKQKYRPTKDTNGDEYTEVLRAFTLNEADQAVDINKLSIVAKDNGLTIKPWLHLTNKDGSQNVGMIRMNLGNVLRGMRRNGADVRIGDKVFKGLPQKEKAKKAPKKKETK